jgi:hypothetical protein
MRMLKSCLCTAALYFLPIQLLSSAPPHSPASAHLQLAFSSLLCNTSNHSTPLPLCFLLPIVSCLCTATLTFLRLLSSAPSLSPTSLHICCHPSLHLQSSATPLIARPPETVFRITLCRYMLKPCLCRAVPTFLQHLSSPPPSSTSSQPQPQPQPSIPEPPNHLRPYLPTVPVLTHISASVHHSHS